VTVCEYPDGRLEIRHGDEVLSYRVFDKMQRVNQAAIVENKHLGAALELVRAMQAEAPHLRKRNNATPMRRSQPTHMFPDHAGETLAKVDRRSLGLQRLKRGPRLSNEELTARGLSRFIRP
jgi:hypothetical protein